MNNSCNVLNSLPESLSYSKYLRKVDRYLELSLASILAFKTSFYNLEKGLV